MLSNLRFADYSGDQEPRKIEKINPLVDLLRSKTQSLYIIGETGCIDEFLMLYKGRLYMKQYIPKKRARFGIKGFSLNDSETAYTYDIEVYSGREETQAWCPNIDTEDLSTSEKIVVHLLNRSNLMNMGFEVVVDNWFNSVRLGFYLLERNTFCLGTIRANRGVPEQLVVHPMQPISSEFARCDSTLVVKFRDKRVVYVSSTKHPATLIPKHRRGRDNAEVQNYKPEIIEKYNLSMNGTDRIDQMLSSVKCSRKSFIWPKKLGIFLMQRIGVVNGFILAKKYFPVEMRRRTLAEYTLLLVENLYSLSIPSRPAVGLRIVHHQLEEIPATSTRPRPSARCRECYKTEGAAAKQSRYRCAECPSKPALYRTPWTCFNTWHKYV